MFWPPDAGGREKHLHGPHGSERRLMARPVLPSTPPRAPEALDCVWAEPTRKCSTRGQRCDPPTLSPLRRPVNPEPACQSRGRVAPRKMDSGWLSMACSRGKKHWLTPFALFRMRLEAAEGTVALGWDHGWNSRGLGWDTHADTHRCLVAPRHLGLELLLRWAARLEPTAEEPGPWGAAKPRGGRCWGAPQKRAARRGPQHITT